MNFTSGLTKKQPQQANHEDFGGDKLSAPRRILGDAPLFLDSSQTRALQRGFVGSLYFLSMGSEKQTSGYFSAKQSNLLTMSETK